MCYGHILHLILICESYFGLWQFSYNKPKSFICLSRIQTTKKQKRSCSSVALSLMAATFQPAATAWPATRNTTHHHQASLQHSNDQQPVELPAMCCCLPSVTTCYCYCELLPVATCCCLAGHQPPTGHLSAMTTPQPWQPLAAPPLLQISHQTLVIKHEEWWKS